jgi:two-component system, NarL family, response regulator LiaR
VSDLHRNRRPVSVAAVNDYELVVHGLAAMLGRFRDRVEVRDAIVVGEPLDVPVDVALFDLYGRGRSAIEVIRLLAAVPDIGAVVVFSVEHDRRMMTAASEAGARGFISKGLPAEAIVDAIGKVAAGHQVEASARSSVTNPSLSWPGKNLGLTARESEVLALVASGMTNSEIAQVLFLSHDTVKSHIRSVYVKLGIRNRVEASLFVNASDDYRGPGASAHEERAATGDGASA